MDFFYPNFNNDMWRIWGLLCFGDKNYFVDREARCFRKEAITDFLTRQGIALYDTATAVIRTKNTASDKDLQVVEPTDIDALLSRLPECSTIVATGQKAVELLATHFNVLPPPVGSFVAFTSNGRPLRLYRMPSSSRAYPLKLENKAKAYSVLLEIP